MEESLFWADQIAREIKERVGNEPVLKKIVKKGYIVYDEKTPSGMIHIGSGRGWIIHDTIAKAMRDLGLKARFILSSDDYDPYDKPNKELLEFNKYLGMPFRNIPSPVKGYKSFADYYFTQATDKFKDLGIDAELESTGEHYLKGDFNGAIKTVLDNAEKIQAIFYRIYDKPYDKLPFCPICEKCGKIGTTKAIKWDKEKEMVYYECQKDFVKWAEGCNYKGWVSPYNGSGKLPWKVEWAAKWPTIGVVCELAGKDHFSAGGSREVAVAICNEVFDFPPPYPSTRTSIGKGYEFLNIGGRKMSTSKGMGFSFAEIDQYLPAKMIRYLLISSRPGSVVDFDPFRPNDVILLYERYDKTERIYFKKEECEKKEYLQNKRIYELSNLKIPKKNPVQISLQYASTAIQIGLNEDGALDILKKNGTIGKISSEEEKIILERLNEAKRWVERFAPDEYKFKLQEKIPENLKLTEKQREALHEIAKILDKKWDEKKTYEEFYNICKRINIIPKELFEAGYMVLLNKTKGPKLAGFILLIGKEKVKKMFEKV